MYVQAAELAMKNLPRSAIRNGLIDQGCAPDIATEIAIHAETNRKQMVRNRAWNDLDAALLVILIGAAITGLSYVLASRYGGFYLITWGVIIFGGYGLIKAVYYLLSGEMPMSDDEERANAASSDRDRQVAQLTCQELEESMYVFDRLEVELAYQEWFEGIQSLTGRTSTKQQVYEWILINGCDRQMAAARVLLQEANDEVEEGKPATIRSPRKAA